MKAQRKKLPSDYPQFAFRISIEDKEKIQKLVDEIHKDINKGKDQFLKKIKKNDILVEALMLGLKKLRY